MNDENEREDGQEIDAGLVVPHASETDEVRQALLTSSIDEEGPTAAAAARKLQGYVYKAHALSQIPESEFKTEQERFAAAEAIARGMTGQDDPLGRLWNGGKGFETGGEYLRSVKETFMRGMQAAATPRLQQYLSADEDEKNRLASEAAPTLGKFANWMGDVYVSSGPLNEGEMASAPDDVREASEVLKSAMVDEDPEAKKAAEEKVLGWRRNGKHLMEYRAAYEEKLMRENALMFLPDVLKHLKSEDARKLCSEIIDHPERRPADYGERLKALDTGDIEIIGRINHMVTPRGEGGFWNTIGDAALAALSSVNGVLRGGAGQLYKGYAGLNNLGAELLTDEPEAWKIDYNAALRRRTALWAAGEGLGADINQISEDHGMVASGLIGIAGVLPVLPMFNSAAGLGTLTVESMAQMDERMVREGVDVTDPKYVAGSMLAAGLQTYVMKRGFAKTFGAKMTEKEAIELQTAWLKGVMAGLSKMPTYRNLTAHTLGGAMAMGLSAGIGEINAAVAKNGIDADALAEGGKAFVEEFVGSIPDMAVFAGSGMLKGHAERSGGWRRMFTDAGLATRDAGLKDVMERKYTWLSSQRVSKELDDLRLDLAQRWIAHAHEVYSSGGKDALAKRFSFDAGMVDELADLFEDVRMHEGSRPTPAPSASEEPGVKSEKSGGRRKGSGRQKDYYRAQVDERRRERDIENWNRQEEELTRRANGLATRLFENRENAERLIDELEPIRNIWAKGGGMIESVTEDGTKVTIDPGQTALVKAGFSKETAKEFSDIFREEQRRRCSPAAFNGIQAIYERSTRGMTTARGNLGSVLQKGRITERDGRAFVNFTKPTGESVDVEISRGAAEFTLEDVSGKSGDNMAGQVEERTKGKVKAADWAAMTPEERLETVKRYNLVQAGNFVLTDPHDPSITVDTDGARRIVGRIETPAVGGKPFHEVAHGYFRFMQESGFWSEADVKWLRETFGEPRAKNGFFDKDGNKVRRDELFNEEAACDAVQAYAAKKLNGSLTDEPPALRKLWTFARRMVHLTERRVAEEKLAADREQALYDAILTGTFSHIADLKVAEKPVAPKPSGGGEGAAKPQTGTLPKEPGRFKTVTKTPETVTETGADAAKPTEGAAKPEVKSEVTFEALTPTGGKKIRGHYEFVPLAKLLHSNKPGYPMELQGRDRKDNKAEQQTRNDHVANFEAGYLLADPKTDSGAMVVVKRPAEGGGVEYVVVSGNGRTMVLEDLAAKNLYDRYRNPAKAFAVENGIENGVPDGENPVLVRVIDDLGGATLKEIADLSNTNAIQQMNEEEQARADADTILKLDIARLYAANADGSPNMTPGANADFFREFVKGIGDTGMLNSDGSVTEALRLRAQRALLAIACGQGERGRDTVKALVEQAATLGIERQKEAAAAMAPHVAAAEARPEFAIGPDVSRAFADFLDFMRNRDTGKKWGTVEEYLKQGDMLDPRSEIAGSILRMLGERKSPGYVAEVARMYAEAAKGEQDGLFGEARKPAEIWREAEKSVAEDGGRRWSIVTIGGQDIALITNLADAAKISPKDPSSIEDYIKRHLEEHVEMLAGGTASITEKSARHYAWSVVRGVDGRQMRRARAKAATVIGDLIRMFTADNSTYENKPGKEGVAWRNRLPFGIPRADQSGKVIGGTVYDADVIVKDEGHGKFFYDVSHLKKNEALTRQLDNQAEALVRANSTAITPEEAGSASGASASSIAQSGAGGNGPTELADKVRRIDPDAKRWSIATRLDEERQLIEERGGQLILAHHGTDSRGFTRFEKSDDLGYFFAKSRNTAASYIRKGRRGDEEKPGMPNYEDVMTFLNDEASGYTPEEVAAMSYEEKIQAYTEGTLENSGVYDVALKMEDPYVIDCHGAAWNAIYEIPDGMDQRTYDRVSFEFDPDARQGKLRLRYEEFGEDSEADEWFDNLNDFIRVCKERFGEDFGRDELEKIEKAYSNGEYYHEDVIDGRQEKSEAGAMWTFDAVSGEGWGVFPRKTREIVEDAANMGCDGVIFHNVVDNGGGIREADADDVYVVMKPEQVKSVDDMTYADDGSIIPAEKRLDWSNRDIRWSVGQLYTGSAADYEKPSLLKVGTGEGSQVYGWGLYASSVRSVAETYTDSSYDKNTWARNYLAKHKGDRSAAVKELKYAAKYVSREARTAALGAAKLISSGKPIPKTGNIYEQTFFTNRAPGDESHLLKWYEPISDEQQKWIADQISKEGLEKQIFNDYHHGEYDDPGTIGQSLSTKYDSVEDWLKNSTAAKIYEGLEMGLDSPQAASEFLARADIDGIKYPVDSYGGKTVKDGDKAGWNYVSFRDDNIRVDHKWVDGVPRWSITKLDDGTDIALVRPNDVPSNVKLVDRDSVEKFILAHIEDAVPSLTGTGISITELSAKHFARSPYAEKLRRKDRKMLRARNKTIGILKDIISLSTADDTTETAKDHPEENYRVWECTVPFGVPEYDEKAKLVGGKVFDAKVIIEDRGKGKIFYDLVDLKENGDLSGRLTKHTELFETGRGGTDPSRVDQGSPSASPSADLRSPAVIGETPRSIAQSAADGNAAEDPFFALGNQKRRRDAERRDPEAVARQAIVALTQGGEEDKTSALVAFVAYRELTGGAKPRAKTISTLGFQMGMKTVAVGKIVREGEGLAKRMRDTVIAEACERGDVATAMAMLARERMADAAAERIVSGAAQRGGYLKEKGEIAQKAIMEREISKLVRATNAATLEDMERDTGLDLASEILAADPDKFDPSKAHKKGEGGSAPDEQSSGDGGGDGADAPADVPFEELTDLQKARRKERQAAAEKRVAEMIEKAKARAEKKAANHKASTDAAGRDPENQAAFDAENGGEGGGGAAAGAAEAEKPDLKTFADFKTKEEFAAFLRAWATDAFAKSIGIRELTKAGKHRLFAEFYRKTVIRELSDLADKLLPPKGARAWANRRLGEIEQGTAPDTIERISGDVFALINRNAIREERTALIQKFRNDVRRYYNGEKFDELKQDTDRKLTGWIEESARYIHRVCNLAIRSINGEPSQIEQEREKLREIIDKRSEIHDESGKKTVDWAITDDKARRALAKLELLDRFGGMRELMPGEIADRTAEALEYLEKKAGELEKSWEETRRVTDGLIRDFAGGVIGPKGGMRYERGKWVGAWFDGLADALNGMIRLRLQHLTRFADPKAKEAADRAINSFVTMLGDGEVAYSRITDRDRKAFAKALHAIFKGDNARIEEWMNRMTENIPVELSRQISNQGFAEGMTYGQMFQLLVSIEQGSMRPNVEANGRDGQSRLIRDWIINNPDGTRTRMFTSEDALFVDWLREFYKSTRAEASKVTERMNGMPIYSPDPLYCPVKMWTGDIRRDLHSDTGRWDPVGSVFARRVENLRDFDESASVLGMFFDRSAARAQLIAWAERGTILRNVFTDVGVRSSIERAFGKGEYSRIAKQIEQTMTGGEGAKKTPGEIAVADKAMNYITYASLGFNPLSAMKQTTSFPVWANAIGWTRLWHHMKHFDKAALKHLMESEEFKVRYGDQVNGGMDIATRGLNENPGRSRVAQMFQKWSMGLLKLGDFAPGGWIAQGVYKDFLDKHMKEGMDFDAADRLSITETFNLLEETQQSGRTYNTNELSREHGRIGRLLTQFATSPLQQLQYQMQAIREVRDLWRYRPAAKDAGWEENFADAKSKLVRATVINHVLLPAALHAVTNIYKLAMGYDPEWEQDGWHQTLLRDLLLGQFSRVFYIGTMAETTFDALFAGKRPTFLTLLPAEGAITQMANIAFTARDVFMGMDPDKMRKDIDRLLKSTSVTRTPYDIIWRATGRDMNQRKEFIRKGKMPK